MKKNYRYANYRHRGGAVNNLGDQVHILAIGFLYEEMKIPKSEIIYIDTNDLSTYAGTPVVLPVSMSLIKYNEHGIAGIFSKNITPVFVSLFIAKDVLSQEEVRYLRSHEPVGCRDEGTYNTLVKHGIHAYLGGCLTVVFPQRLKTSAQKKTFIIDSRSFKDNIPLEIAKGAIRDTHHLSGEIEDPLRLAREQLERYRDEAGLVITTLMHCAVPCMAMGIPVVLAKNVVPYRFGWLEALLHIYTPSEYSKINWNPLSVDYESHKDVVKTLFKKRMNGEDASQEITLVHNFYVNRVRNEYIWDVFTSIQKFLDEMWTDRRKTYQYAVWGLTQIAEMTIHYISTNYPNAKLTHAYDLRKNLSIHGVLSSSPDDIADAPDETVFVTAPAVRALARAFFRQIEKPRHLYVIPQY